jgi:uncharacterized protein YdgA (DUF945 family)
MRNQINTNPIQQFIQQVKAADLSQQREIKMDIKNAKLLAYCLTEVNTRLMEDYDTLLNKVLQNSGQSINVQMDGGGFK